VGFRPFINRLATELGLAGHVGNDSEKVFIQVAGPIELIDRFVARIVTDAPPLARIDRIERPGRTRRPAGTHSEFDTDIDLDFDGAIDAGFRIVDSQTVAGPRTPIPPDSALCADCLAELFDPTDRRYKHPFITCTNCGPRFTIITGVPYDRPATTMARFPMCEPCEAEYRDPVDRRYHAQPICCHHCGPTLSYYPVITGSEAEAEADGSDAIAACAADLGEGKVVAVKGLGGYHLACDARSQAAVAELRRRKHRPEKPFAVMVADLAAARRLAEVSDDEARLLTSPAAPIVLLRARSGNGLAAAVAPGNPLIGIMVAYTPVHHLLLHQLADRPGNLDSGNPEAVNLEPGKPEPGQPVALVMTSANRGGEPIAASAERLGDLCDLIDGVLDNDRPIVQPCDDSVVRVVADRILPIRRARGYTPLSIPMISPSNGHRPVLAAGAELKNTICVAADGRAWLSQHIGDMENLATLEAFEATVAHYLDHYRVQPQVVAADAHPGYLSSRWAHRSHSDRLVEVQHHHAHVAAVMAEHQLDPTEPVIGFAFDGTGYGDDGTIWGGEVLMASAHRYRRAAHLAPVQLPGGDTAIQQPAKVALAHLHRADLRWSAGEQPGAELLAPAAHLAAANGERGLAMLGQQLDGGFGCIPTTSMGRLFDAVASLIGLRHEIGYEAQAAIELEIAAIDGRRASGGDHPAYRFALDQLDKLDQLEPMVIDPAPVLRALLADLATGQAATTMAWRFHVAVAHMVERVATRLRADTGKTTVALTGGVFQNALLTELCIDRLEHTGFIVLTHSLVPPNDGGLALGQAFIAANYGRDPNPHRQPNPQTAPTRTEPRG
jgi:hydrogenase maturation protein HypF